MTANDDQQASIRAISAVVAQLLGALPSRAWGQVLANAADDLGQADTAALDVLENLRRQSETWQDRHEQTRHAARAAVMGA